MRLFIISHPETVTTIPLEQYLPRLARDNIRCTTVHFYHRHEVLSKKPRIRRLYLRFGQYWTDSQLSKRSGNMRPGDVILITHPKQISYIGAKEAVRHPDTRVLLWLDSTNYGDCEPYDWFLRRYVDTVLVKDEATRTYAANRYNDVRLLRISLDDQEHSAYEDFRQALYPTIKIYGLFYRFPEILQKTLVALNETDIDIRLFVGENFSDRSSSTANRIPPNLNDRIVHGYALFHRNIYGSALEYLYTDLFPPGRSDAFVVFTDLDMVIPADCGNWLRMMLEKFWAFEDLAALSLDFDLFNWNPAIAKGHQPPQRRLWDRSMGIHRMRSGAWFLAIRRHIVEEYFSSARPFGDKLLFDYIDQNYSQKTYGRLPIYCHHLSWDLETTAPDYVEQKYKSFYSKVYERHPLPEHEVLLRRQTVGKEEAPKHSAKNGPGGNNSSVALEFQT